jgi:hypothetical protein
MFGRATLCHGREGTGPFAGWDAVRVPRPSFPDYARLCIGLGEGMGSKSDPDWVVGCSPRYQERQTSIENGKTARAFAEPTE